MPHADSGDYTWEYAIHGEHITCQPAARPNGAGYDVRTFSQRVEGQLAALQAEQAALRQVVTMLVDTLADLGVAVRQ